MFVHIHHVDLVTCRVAVEQQSPVNDLEIKPATESSPLTLRHKIADSFVWLVMFVACLFMLVGHVFPPADHVALKILGFLERIN